MAPKAQIWKYFIKIDGGGKCKICDKDIKTKNNTTNLHNHFKSIHAIVLEKKKKTHTSKSV